MNLFFKNNYLISIVVVVFVTLKKINKQFLVHANILIHKTIFHDKTSSILKIYDMFFGINAAAARKIVIVNLTDGVYKKVVLVVVRIFF